MKRTIALADVHLVSSSPADVDEDLARLVSSHPGARLLVVGDLFDLSSEHPRQPEERAVRDVLGRHARVRAALGTHLEAGGELWLVAGNHDALVGSRPFRDTLASALELSAEARARLVTTPWFFRLGEVHVEHGHAYDPDNAPEHPLVHGRDSLGVHFVKEFIAPTGAHRYLGANDETPLALLLSAFRWYGPRGPYVVYRYFHAAFLALSRSGPFYGAHDELARAEAHLVEFLAEHGLDRELAEQVHALRATPTTRSLRKTASRLYFDRVTATLALATGVGLAAAGKPRAALSALLGGGAIMLGSWSLGHNRFRGTVERQLELGAASIAELTGAKLVLFGHTHKEALEERYANTGSFAFPGRAPGRPYLELEGSLDAPVATRRYLERRRP
jgi:predicted phosphodiesterase